MFYIIRPCCLTHFQVFKFSGASKLHDPTTNMKLVQIKGKEKLNRIIKSQPITHATLLFLFEIQWLFLNFIFEERTFLPFITSNCNNNCLRWWKTEKKPVRTNLIPISKIEMNNLLMVCPLKCQGFSGAITAE